MRILLLTPQRPYPPHQGTTLRNFNLVKELAKRHTVCLLTFLEPDQDPNDDGPLTEWCEWVEKIPVPQRTTSLRLRQMLTSRRPDMGWRLWSPQFEARLATRLQEKPFDVVEIEGFEMSPYLATIEATQPKPFILYDGHNAEWILQKRAVQADLKKPKRWPAALYSSIQWQRLRRYEGDLLQRANHTVAMSEPDKVALQDVCPGAPITIVPNGVDLAAYRQFEGDPIAYDLLFTGKMDFRPNVDAMLWFGQQVLPLIQAQRPDTTFAVVGQRPHPRLDSLRDIPGITITGYVDDVRPYIAGATVYIAPLRVGGGTRLKLLEAMAMGKVIVATTVGAEGYPVVNHQEMILADHPEQFTKEVIALLNNPTQRDKIGQAGRLFAEAHYGWDALVPKIEDCYP
ncbi:MAG: glycosyltransferase [Chloroflexota bacterium]